MRAVLLWTINDFLAYGMMSGWSTIGNMACPTYNKDICSLGLRSKIVTWDIAAFYLQIIVGE